ncbi:MAG: MFS transporter [Bacteroidales bacterium]|nr:MFS transporter [Bacteroidales bacterium]MBN2699745.1 MFS transporter [Bacteroidales bacterium]
MKSANAETKRTGVGNVRWRILVLIFFATTINYVDRQVIGLLKPFIAEDLGWSEAAYGYIVSAFQAAYAIGLLISGSLLDRFGTRLGYTIAIFIWSLAGMVHAAARSALSFGIARFFLGLGESANFPAAVKSVAEWFPKKERALATGWFNSGSNVGAIAAPVIVSAITLAYGWQWAFIITGSLGFIWILFWLLFYKLPEKHRKISHAEYEFIRSDNEPETAQALKWKELFLHRETIAICLGRFVTDWVWWFYLFWTPDFLNNRFGIDIKLMVLPLIVIYSVSGAGGIFGGWLSSLFLKRGKSIDYSRKVTIFICACMVFPVVAVSGIDNIWIVTAIIALAAAGHAGWASNIFTIVSDIFPRNAVATVVGMSGFAGAIGGALAASFVGLLLQFTASYFLVFLIAGSMYFLAWLILKLMIPRIRPVCLS